MSACADKTISYYTIICEMIFHNGALALKFRADNMFISLMK